MKVILLLIYLAPFTIFSQSGKQPRLAADNFTKEVRENEFVNCRKIKNLGVVIYLNEEIKAFDNFRAEFHRNGEDGDVLVGYKIFSPGTKEFTKKYASQDSIQLKLLTEENHWNTSDFQINSLAFNAAWFVSNVYCTLHEIKHVNFYVIVRGYTKTGEKNNFGEELYSGKDLSPKSVLIRNWDFSK